MSFAKFYVPLLEISVAFFVIYLGPLGMAAVARRFSSVRRRPVLEFLWSHFRGFLLGTAVSVTTFLILSVSWENLMIEAVRKGAAELRRFAGFDPIEICMARAHEEFGFTPYTFLDAASEFSIIGIDTLTRRQHLIANGNQLLLTSVFTSLSPEELYRDALKMYCDEILT